LKIFIAEMEDCVEDVEDLALLYERRFRANEIGEYIRNENEALLSREALGFRQILGEIRKLDPTAYAGADQLAAELIETARRTVEAFEEPQAVFGIAKRKLLKVLRYIESA
jgi:hypothetical protein